MIMACPNNVVIAGWPFGGYIGYLRHFCTLGIPEVWAGAAHTFSIAVAIKKHS